MVFAMKSRFLWAARLVAAGVVSGVMGHAAQAGTVADRVLAAKRLHCGVIAEPLDWNKEDLHASLAPLSAEICRAVSTSLFGRPDQFDLQSYNSERDGLDGLHQGKSDIVAGVTPNAGNASLYNARFSIPFFQDGQGFMVHREEGIHSLADIEGHKLCFIDGTDNAAVVQSVLSARHIKPVPFTFQEEGEMDAAIMDRHCQVTSAYVSKLAEARASFHNARDYVLLPDLLLLAPATVAVDAQDPRMAGIVDYTISALLQAEFLGVTHQNVMSVKAGDDPRLQRLLGADWATAQGLGLAHDWSRIVIAAVGNYAEIYNRSVGPGTPFNLPRGPNGLWSNGGLMAPLPMQ
jgi:general L-amino acid transport system substrate-binding protein